MFKNQFDSRSIRFGSAYGQRFMHPGQYRYNIVSAGSGEMVDSWPCVVEVAPRVGKPLMKQHSVSVHYDGKKFGTDRDKIAIHEGDLVLWSCMDAKFSGFEVRGEKRFFSSSRLSNECGYSHVFGMPGEYRWRDAHGGQCAGVVRVQAVRPGDAEELAQWRNKLSQGVLVMIRDGRAEPAEVDIVTGQTVFFSVITGPGLSVTNELYVR